MAEHLLSLGVVLGSTSNAKKKEMKKKKITSPALNCANRIKFILNAKQKNYENETQS